MNTTPGPTLLGIDVLWVSSILAGMAALAVMFAIYTAVTIRDPMQKRVKSLNERREQLKAGIVTQTAKKRAQLVRKNETTEKMKDTLSALNGVSRWIGSLVAGRSTASAPSRPAFTCRSV